MTNTEIKKALYKEKPIAKMEYIFNGDIYYETTLSDMYNVFFKVPMEETKGAYFLKEMPAQALIRWIWAEEN